MSDSQQPPLAPLDQTESKGSLALTLLLGLALIIVITPLSMFLTSMTVNSDMETASPSAWAVGLLFSAVLALLPLRILSKRKALSRPNLVLLYVMLSVAVPIMNMGLARPLVLSMQAVAHEYLYYGTNTYRTAYGNLDKKWQPVSPTLEGVAWLESYKILRELDDSNLEKERQERMEKTLNQLDQQQSPPVEILDKMGMDALLEVQLKAQNVGVDLDLQSRITQAEAQSKEARQRLAEKLLQTEDLLFSATKANLSSSSTSLKGRIQRSLQWVPPSQREAFESDIQSLNDLWPELKVAASKLSSEDRRALFSQMVEARVANLEQMEVEAFNMHRSNVLFRVDRRDRVLVMGMDGKNYKGLQTPSQNFKGLIESAWPTVADQRRLEEQSFGESLSSLYQKIPWNIWAYPLLNWCLLFSVIIILLMALAEWFRRKWVERENLAFPLVDIVDSILRHDAELETAEDPTRPKARPTWFSGAALGGLSIGFLLVCAEALGWYGYAAEPFQPVFNISGELFTSGSLRSLNGIQFVLSPIIIGIAFLISLEMSFSIWFTFIIYNIVAFLINSGEGGQIRDNLWTGFGGGKNYPFPMEQMLGACFIYSMVLIWNAKSSDKDVAGSSFFPKRLVSWSIWLCLLIVAACFWSQGVQHVGLIILFIVCLMAQTIAAARVRAETGLPAQHVSYEYTKLPMIFGMTGSTGKDTFASYINIVFLPVTLLFRLLPQHLENIELARRHHLSYGKIALGSVLASLVAIFVGVFSFIMFSYYHGGEFALSTYPVEGMGNPGPKGVAHYPIWVAHFLSEQGLDKYVQVHQVRMMAILVGAAVVGFMIFARKKWLRFPLHPAGYLLLLLSMNYDWTSSYVKGDSGNSDSTLVWGGVLIAWGIKKLIINYGGMIGYKKAKPFFIGLVVGSIFCVFFWNMIDLTFSLMHTTLDPQTLNESGWMNIVKPFLDKAPFSPKYY